MLIITAYAFLLTSPGSQASAESGRIHLKVSTSSEVVAAMLTASQTGAPTTITVAPGRYVLVRDAATSPSSGVLPAVSTTVRIRAEDAASTSFESNQNGRIFTVTTSGSLIVSGLTVTGGGGDLDGGGAAANFGGFLRFDRCRLVGNSAGGRAIGGAVLSVDARLHIEDSVLMDNLVAGSGGAIGVVGGSAYLNSVTIRDNATEFGGAGGGIYSRNASMTIVGSTIAGNRAGYEFPSGTGAGRGGGIFSSGKLWLRESAVVENSAFGSGEVSGEGGGILSIGVTTIKNSTVAANTADTFGGGIYNTGNLTLQGTTLTHNETRDVQGMACDPTAQPCAGGGGVWNQHPGRVRVVRSVLAGNRNLASRPGPFSNGPDCSGTVLSDGNNAIGDISGCDLKPSWVLRGKPTNDLIGVDPALGPLQDNGEAGFEHYPLLAHSPLIDAGGVISKTCPKSDQIGKPRTDANGDGKRECDIGAIEFQ